MTRPNGSEIDLRALWETGVALDDAWVRFAHFFDSFALRALHTYPDNDDILIGINEPRYRKLNLGWLPPSWEGRQKKLEIVTHNERINLLNKIYHGELWAIGFRTMTNGFDEPTRVPRQYFFVDERPDRVEWPDIHWGKGELRSGADSYFDIRIVRAPVETAEPSPLSDGLRSSHDTDSVQASSRAVRVGRPRGKDKIVEAIEKLWPDPAFQALENRTQQARELRARLRGETARDKDQMQGYKTSTLARLIGEYATKCASEKTE